MSEANIEIVRRMYEHFAKGDIARMAETMSEDVLCVTAPDQPDAQPFRGRAKFVAYGESWLEAFDSYEVEITELVDRGDWVIVVGSVRAHGRSSGVVVEDDYGWLYRLRDGMVVEYHECGSKEEALEAAGFTD